MEMSTHEGRSAAPAAGRRTGVIVFAWPGLVPLLALALLAAPTDLAAQGWIEPLPDRPQRTTVERVRTEVRVQVEGRTAQVEVSEWFRNRGRRVAEGDYHYPLPREAAFDGFSLFQGERELRGEIMDVARAREIYESIVRRRKDPALIEFAGHGLLRSRIFPIEPGETRKVVLRYTQVLERAGEALQFRYAAPAVAAGGRTATGPGAGGGTSRPSRPAPLSLELTADDGERFLDPFSPTHELETSRHGGGLSVRASGDLTGRLSLFLPLADRDVGLTVATHATHGEDGWVMLTLTPGRAEVEPRPREVTVVLDVSGSMSGAKIQQARSALHQLLGSLGPRDRFRLLAYSTTVRPHALEWASAGDDEQLADARRWIDALAAEGGTNIGAALDEAFRLDSPEERLPVVLFLTDGIPTVGEQSVDRIAARAEERRGRARVFAFGVGHDVNTALLDRLTEAGRGATGYVEPDESVERALSTLAGKIRHPVLTDLSLLRAPVRLTELYPVEIPDLFAGEEVVLFGRYERPESEEVRGELVLEGRRGGRTERFSVEARFPEIREAGGFLPRLWASRKLGFLTRRTWTEGAAPELVEEIRRIALRYGLPSPYTSYLVTEPERTVRHGDPRRSGRNLAPASEGAGAVERARAARSLRDVAREADLDALDAADDAAEDRAADVRRVAGRVFRLADGVWTDAAEAEGGREIVIEPYSRAYFDLLRALPELRPYWSAFERIRVAAGDLSLELSPSGRDTLGDAELDRIVHAFRRGPAPR